MTLNKGSGNLVQEQRGGGIFIFLRQIYCVNALTVTDHGSISTFQLIYVTFSAVYSS